MPDTDGHIELERTIDSIVVGVRHRESLGDLDSLMESIKRLGLLQPVTVTPDGVLVCGRRRLEAVRRLGWRTLRVWVRSGISDDLSRLLAERDDNAERKDLDDVEQSRLYAEIKTLLAEDAARRQLATQFSATGAQTQDDGGGDSPPPELCAGKARDQAAQLITGGASYHRHEQVEAIRKVADDLSSPPAMRALANRELEAIRNGAKVHGAYTRFRDALALEESTTNSSTEDPLHLMAADALTRAKRDLAEQRSKTRTHRRPDTPRRSTRAFLLTWGDLVGWTAHYDANDIADDLADEDWDMFERVLSDTQAFAVLVRQARVANPARASA